MSIPIDKFVKKWCKLWVTLIFLAAVPSLACCWEGSGQMLWTEWYCHQTVHTVVQHLQMREVKRGLSVHCGCSFSSTDLVGTCTVILFRSVPDLFWQMLLVIVYCACLNVYGLWCQLQPGLSVKCTHYKPKSKMIWTVCWRLSEGCYGRLIIQFTEDHIAKILITWWLPLKQQGQLPQAT